MGIVSKNFCQTMMNNVDGEFAAYDRALPKNRDWQSILWVRYFSFSMTIRKHKIAEMNVKGVNKYNSNLDLAKRFPIVFKQKRNIKTQIITLSLLTGMLFCIMLDLRNSIIIKKPFIIIETVSKILISFTLLILPAQTIVYGIIPVNTNV